jgi:hypothetical protein
MRLNPLLDTSVFKDFDAVHALFFPGAMQGEYCDACQVSAYLCHQFACAAVFL